MLYVILIAILIVALFVFFFHDDRDGTYDQRETSSKHSVILPPEEATYSRKPTERHGASAPKSRTPNVQAPKSRVNLTPNAQAPKSRAPKAKPSLVVPTPRVKTRAYKPVPSAQQNPVSETSLSWSFLYSLEYDDTILGDTFESEITGMNYCCSPSDVGPVNGIVVPEPNNPHDPRAQMVVRADGKKIGYIPRYALDEYEDFNEDNLICPFSGRITVDQNGYITAVILVALPESREFVKDELSDYVDE